MLLDTEIDEVHKRYECEGGGTADGTGAGLHAGDEADKVVDQDKEEQRGQKREVLLPVVANDTLGDIVLHVLDDPLDAVNEEALGDNLLLLSKREKDHEHDDSGDKQPERVLRQARVKVTHDRSRGELSDELGDRAG